MTDLYHQIASWFAAHVTWWTMFGLVGQALFTSRFLVQWIASEKEKKSVIPTAFWYFSIAGGLIVFVYGVGRDDLVIMLGQGAGIFIYARNLYFIHREKKLARELADDARL